jgi:hypothetical protein
LQECELLRPQIPEGGEQDRVEQVLQTLQKALYPQRIQKVGHAGFYHPPHKDGWQASPLLSRELRSGKPSFAKAMEGKSRGA